MVDGEGNSALGNPSLEANHTGDVGRVRWLRDIADNDLVYLIGMYAG